MPEPIVITQYGEDPRDPPGLKRGRCSCGSPIAFELNIAQFGYTFSHDEMPLLCYPGWLNRDEHNRLMQDVSDMLIHYHAWNRRFQTSV